MVPQVPGELGTTRIIYTIVHILQFQWYFTEYHDTEVITTLNTSIYQCSVLPNKDLLFTSTLNQLQIKFAACHYTGSVAQDQPVRLCSLT